MAKGLITHAYLEDTADAIRVLRGESDTYTPDEFGEKIIDAIPDIEVTDDIVSVTDAAAYPAEGLEFAIEPVQDLHGYDKPWPAGGGKNKFNTNGITSFTNMELVGGIFKNTATDTKTSFAMSVQLWNDSTFITEFQKSITDTGRKSVTFSISSTITRIRLKHNGSSNDIGFWFDWNEQGTYTLSLNVTGVDPTTIGGLSFTDVQLELGSTATSYEPYANICPISGWTVVQGKRTGKNLFDVNATTDGYYNANGAFILNTSYKITDYIPVESEVLVTGYIESSTIYSVWFDVNKTKTGTAFTLEESANRLTVPQGAKYLRCSLNSATIAGGNFAVSTGTPIPITFPTEAGTVYGGKVDVVNGKLLAYPEYDSYNGETLTGKWISSMDAYVEGTTPTIGAQVVDLSGVGTEYNIAPQEVELLLGDNNVWCDTGDTTLEYKVDLGRYIEKLKATQATPQLSLSRQAVSLDAARDVEPVTQEIKADVSERKSAEAKEQEEQEQGGDAG